MPDRATGRMETAMDHNVLKRVCEALPRWTPPAVDGDIPHGDMPGDKVEINEGHIAKANVIFPLLLPLAARAAEETGRAVVAVCGGSGVGKSETASLLSHYLRCAGVGAYTLSGDNYPRRIPAQNDAERMRCFRLAGIRGMLKAGCYSPENAAALKSLQEQGLDPEPGQAERWPWLRPYQEAGKEALSRYLGTELEQEYDQLSDVLARFRAGEPKIWLKRLGREDTAMWYEEKDFSGVSALVLEWTHGNSGLFSGVDIPVLLYNTPAETREYRLARGRDSNADTPFITMVIQLEQAKLDERAAFASIIISKTGEVISYDECRRRMEAGR